MNSQKRTVSFADNIKEPPTSKQKIESTQHSTTDDIIREAEQESITPTPLYESSHTRTFKEKHSLDSDEEDTPKDDGGQLDSELIEGEEEDTNPQHFDNERTTEITPFNLKDEMEEGHFDASGMFIFKKNMIRDNWLDEIDWKKVHNLPEKAAEGDDELSDDADDSDLSVENKLDIYSKMVELMKPSETVTRSLCRLGGSKKQSASDRWKRKKAGKLQPETAETTQNKKNLLELTGLADRLLSNGDMEIYQNTFESLTYKIKQLQESKSGEKKEYDMFADDDNSEFPDVNDKNRIDGNISVETKWEYRNEDKDSSEIKGPFTSKDMLRMQEDGTFGVKGVFVRKCGLDARFYNSTRIDFDLYI